MKSKLNKQHKKQHKKQHNKTKKICIMKGNGKYFNKYRAQHTNSPGIKKFRFTKRAPSINPCYKLNNIYNKWKLLHDELFNNSNIPTNKRNKLEDELAKQIIIDDLNITSHGDYVMYKDFINNIKLCTNKNILKNLSSLLQQIQTADSISFDAINTQIKTCPYKNSCRRKHPIHKSLYHNPNYFTLKLIEIIDKQIKQIKHIST